MIRITATPPPLQSSNNQQITSINNASFRITRESARSVIYLQQTINKFINQSIQNRL